VEKNCFSYLCQTCADYLVLGHCERVLGKQTSSQLLDWPCGGFRAKLRDVELETSEELIPEASGIAITIMVVHARWDAAD
jgi:hypothetical protein